MREVKDGAPNKSICPRVSRSITCLLREHPSILVNVPHRDARRREGLADELAAMAILRPALAAHECRAPPLLERFPEPLDSRLEERLRAHFVVIHLAVGMAGRVPGLAAQRVAHEHVSQPGALDVVLEQVLGELRLELGERRRAHINQILDTVRLEHRQELVERARAIADREQRRMLLRAMAGVDFRIRCWRTRGS